MLPVAAGDGRGWHPMKPAPPVISAGGTIARRLLNGTGCTARSTGEFFSYGEPSRA